MSLASRPTYSDPAYLARLSVHMGPLTAGSGGTTTKFVAAAAYQAYAVTLYAQTLSTSTYTQGGTATASTQQVSLIVITNTSTTTTVALATSTYGPFLSGGQGTVGQVGGANQYALNTSTGTTGFGGVPIPSGSQFYCVSGTDATAVTNCTVDYQIAPLAGLTQ